MLFSPFVPPLVALTKEKVSISTSKNINENYKFLQICVQNYVYIHLRRMEVGRVIFHSQVCTLQAGNSIIPYLGYIPNIFVSQDANIASEMAIFSPFFNKIIVSFELGPYWRIAHVLFPKSRCLVWEKQRWRQERKGSNKNKQL